MATSPAGDASRLPDDVVHHLVAYMERTPDLVGVTDDSGNVLYLNRAASERLGVQPTSDRTLTTDDLFADNAFDIYYEQVRPRLLMGEVWSGYVPVRGAGGDALDMWVTVVGELRPGGEIAWLVVTARDVTEWRHVHDEPHRQTSHDDLTGLATRTLLMEHTEVALGRARRTGQSVAMMYIDLDNLKAVNDSFGHHAGDQVLVEAARRLRDAVRAIDTVARVGGDEFVVLFDGVDDEEEAHALATRVQALLESAPVDTGAAIVNLSASAGVAVGGGGESGHQLLGRADAAMYEAKGERREPPFVGPPPVRGDARTVGVRDVAVALTQRSVVPYFQPVIDLTTGETVGQQALARWIRRPDDVLPARSFVHVVEGSGVGFTLDLAMLRHAASVIAQRGQDQRLYTHVGQRFLTRPGVARYVREVINAAGLQPSQLALVVPGPLIVQRINLVSDAISALRDLDVRLVLNLPAGADIDPPDARDVFHELRLASGWLEEPNTRDAVDKLVALAHQRGMRARVAGVEDEDHDAHLRRIGCAMAEGRLYGPPAALLP